ncbi:MAG: hypothetical protein K2N05_12910 [Muribaculaceae bacterium]|nr:hypothetical protein [Muribaculaceae bacterium]
MNFIISIVFFTFILTGSFYSLNSFFSHSEKIKEEVTVTSKYREKHYRSQRVGRNRYVKGPAYYEYYITVKFQDGSTKNIQLPWKDYEGIKKDSELTLSLRKGLLGSNVIITNDITIDNPRASEKRKRCRFFGTHDKKDSLKYNQRFPSRKDSK